MPTILIIILLLMASAFYLRRFFEQRRLKSTHHTVRQESLDSKDTSHILELHIENSPLAVIEWSSEFRIKQWSARAEELFGWSVEEVFGKHPREIGYIHEDDMLEVDKVVTQLASGQHTRSINRNRNYHKDGRILHCEWYESVLFDESGNLISIWSLVQDVTEQVEAETALHRLNMELEQRVAKRTAQLSVANKELESFADSVSHDLRAPLRAIDGFSQALLEDYGHQLEDNAQHYLRRIRAGSQRMGQLIDALLQLSRITRQEMHRTSVNLSQLASAVIAEWQQIEPQKRVSVQIEPNIMIKSDPSLTRVVLQNLLGNAWKFSSLRPLPKIELGCTILNGEPTYFVRDNGAGFDMAFADKLFIPFQRLHRQEEFVGTGIGLATVQRIIERHNGRIWAESAVQQGATFYFTLG